MKKLFMNFKIIGVFIMSLVIASCSDDENVPQVPASYSISFGTTSNNLSVSLADEIRRINAMTNTKLNLGGHVSVADAKAIFEASCSSLPTTIAKGTEVVGDTEVALTLSNFDEMIATSATIKFTKTRDPRVYVKSHLSETNRAGNKSAAAAYFDGIFMTTASSDVYDIDKTFDTYELAIEFYNKIGSIEDNWPADVVYTSEYSLSATCVDETGENYSSSRSLNGVYETPRIVLPSTTWKAASSTIIFGIFSSQDAKSPAYKVNLDGIDDTQYYTRSGYFMTSKDGNEIYQFLTSTSLQMIKENGITVADKPIYTIE